MDTGATFDATGRYRYTLWRHWDVDAPIVTFIMLNPSTADAQTNDATIRRCIQFATAWGYGGLEVVNLFAFMATRPQSLKQSTDPIGRECDRYLLSAVQRAERVVLAWGNWGVLHQRDRAVLKLLSPHTPLYCLGLNQSGQPRHPLYLHRDSQPIPFVTALQGYG